MRWLGQLKHALFGSGKEHVKGFNLRVKPPGLELRENPLGILLVIRRAHVVRTGAEPLHGIAQVLRILDRAKFIFPVAFRVRTGSGKTIERFFIRTGGGKRQQGDQADRCNEQNSAHGGLLCERREIVYDSRAKWASARPAMTMTAT